MGRIAKGDIKEHEATHKQCVVKQMFGIHTDSNRFENHSLPHFAQVEMAENVGFLVEFLGQFCEHLPSDSEMED